MVIFDQRAPPRRVSNNQVAENKRRACHCAWHQTCLECAREVSSHTFVGGRSICGKKLYGTNLAPSFLWGSAWLRARFARLANRTPPTKTVRKVRTKRTLIRRMQMPSHQPISLLKPPKRAPRRSRRRESPTCIWELSRWAQATLDSPPGS